MNWKEKFKLREKFASCDRHDEDGNLMARGKCPNCLAVKDAFGLSQLITTEIIEQLIEDIESYSTECDRNIQQLRDKWL